MDACIDPNGPSMLVIPNHPVTQACMDMKYRGVRLRFISEITKDNLSYCEELAKIGEIRHLDEIKGNFGIADRKLYHASATTSKLAPPPQLIVSTVRAFVDQQQYFFDMLWRNAIPAKQRIKEPERGLKREFMETMQDPYEVQTILNNILNSATEEILLTLPTKTTTLGNKRLYRYEQEYIIPLLTGKQYPKNSKGTNYFYLILFIVIVFKVIYIMKYATCGFTTMDQLQAFEFKTKNIIMIFIVARKH